jgi:peptidoglycan/LPS O-acetylase OafA/YrhL
MVSPPKSQSAPARVAAVDGLRGLMACVVLAWHALTPFDVSWLLMAANLAVALFFVISGYALTRAWDGRFGVFIVRRVSRLWPVFALCLGAGYLVAGVQPVWSEFLWFPYIGPNDTPAIDPPVWSLFLEAWAILFMPLIIWAGGASWARALAGVLVGVVALLLLHDGRLMVAPLFVLGSYLSRFEIRNRLLEGPAPQWLGKVSYSLYLSHFIVIALAIRAFGPWGGVLAVPAAFGVGWLVWRWVERPSILLSRRLGVMAGEAFAGAARRLRTGFA